VRDAVRLVKLFKANGFTLYRETNHLIFRCPCGHAQVACPKSPRGGRRSIENTTAQIKRTRRACTTEEDANA
jgi:hypothetical protein